MRQDNNDARKIGKWRCPIAQAVHILHNIPHHSRRFFLVFAALMLCLSCPASAQESATHALRNQLLVFDSEYCEWCEIFYQETATGYSLSEEGRQFPIVAHNVYDPLPPEYKDVLPATITPTFVWIQGGREQGRMVGYPGAEIFWWQIAVWWDK